MNRRFLGLLAAGAFALGILTGSAGTIVLRDAAAPATDMTALMADHMTDMSAMPSMMSGGSMMGDRSESMMPGGSMMGDPADSMMPGSPHDQHHPVGTR